MKETRARNGIGGRDFLLSFHVSTIYATQSYADKLGTRIHVLQG